MKRASEVPPEVESSGLRPVTSSIAETARSVNGPGFGHEDVRVRRLPHDPGADAVAAGFGQPLIDQVSQAFVGVVVVEADVEFGARLRRDDVACGIADVDRGEFQVGGLELRAAVIERLVAERHDQPRDIRHRIRRAVRIGDVALHAVDIERAGLRAAAADLDAVAHHLDIGGLAEHAMIEFLAALGDPLQQFHGAVDGDVFLVAGDQERDRAFRFAAMVGEILQHRRDTAGDAALHVDGAAAVKKTVLDIAGEGAVAPGRLRRPAAPRRYGRRR